MPSISRPSALAALLLCLAGPALAEEAGKKRIIDDFGGITFFCRADDEQEWTRRSCANITAEVVRQVEAAGIKIGVLKPGPDAADKAAMAAGFSAETAVSMLFLFEGSPSGNTALNFTAEARLEIRPGVKTGWRQVASQTTTLDPGDWSDEAEKAAATVFAGILGYFTTPR